MVTILDAFPPEESTDFDWETKLKEVVEDNSFKQEVIQWSQTYSDPARLYRRFFDTEEVVR